MTKTIQCPECYKAIEMETQESDCETGKRLKKQVYQLRHALDLAQQALDAERLKCARLEGQLAEMRVDLEMTEMSRQVFEELAKSRKDEKPHGFLSTLFRGGHR